MAVSRRLMLEFLSAAGISLPPERGNEIVDILAEMADEQKLKAAIKARKLEQVKQLERTIQDQQYMLQKLKEELGIAKEQSK